MRTLTIFVGASLLVASPAMAKDILGHFKVRGTGPDGAEYSGVVDVTKTSPATYRIVWVTGGTKFVGTGIGGDGSIAVAYKSGDDTGICLYSAKDDDHIDGVWTYAGGKSIGTEVWSR